MRRILAGALAIIVWFAIVSQFILMLQNRSTPVPETIIRFFSYFTILTNVIVAIYFTGRFFNARNSYKPGILTAVAIYIFIVGVVYQVLLRHVWQPTGLQRVVDELLHSINPLIVLLYWLWYEQKSTIKYRQIAGWLIYPLTYLVYVLVRGSWSGFYPYPFIDVSSIGLSKTLLNSGLLTLFFVVVSIGFIALGSKIKYNDIQQ